MTKKVNQMLLELWQAWSHDQFHGDPVLVTNHTLSEEPFPNVLSELPLTQLYSIMYYVEAVVLFNRIIHELLHHNTYL